MIKWTRHQKENGRSWYDAPGYQITGNGFGGWILICGWDEGREYASLSSAKRAAERHQASVMKEASDDSNNQYR